MGAEKGRITVGFVSHHLEALPRLREHMARHETVVLEEPPHPGFAAMLGGDLSLEDYLLEIDSEFPLFDRAMCEALRELHAAGRRILQVEPYLERLVEIHELFAGGKTVADIERSPSLREVYRAERAATGALIDYYATSVKSSFDDVVKAVQTFALTDARRLVLRDRLRARAIASILSLGRSIFVEAGYIHYPLYRHLLDQTRSSCRVRVVFVLDAAIRELGGRRRNLGPGDVLTLLYAFHPQRPPFMTDLQAARSLIFVKLIQTEELVPGMVLFPHAEDEIRVNSMVDRLGYGDCEKLFEEIRLLKREVALNRVEEYLGSRQKTI